MPSAVRKPVGGALFAYAIICTVQVVFNTFYSGVLARGDVYRVLNYLTAVGILVSVVVVWKRKTGAGYADAPVGRYLEAQAGFYCTLALAYCFSRCGSGCSTWTMASPSARRTTLPGTWYPCSTRWCSGPLGAGLWRSVGKG